MPYSPRPSGGGSSFDPAAPGPIGGDTPDISTFTGITCGQLSIDHYGNVSSYGVRLDFDNVRAGGWLGTLMTGTGIRFGPNPKLSWGPIDAYDPATMDVNLLRAGVGKLAQSNGAAAQTFILSALEVDDSNYSRLVISTVGGYASLTVDEAGSGTGTLVSGIVLDGSNITLPLGSGPTSIGSLFDSGGSALHALVADSAGTATIAASVSGSVPDGTYTMGIGGSTNGTITITAGVITAITEAS